MRRAGLHHVQLAIPRGGEDDCRAFWTGVLGLAELAKPPTLAARGGCWFRSDALEIHCGVEEPFAPATKAHPGILVDDLDRVAAALTSAGHRVDRDEDFPGFDRCYSDDPFGNRLEFLRRRGPDLTVRFPEPQDEDDVRAAQEELADDGFDFAFHLGDDIDDWCGTTRAQARGERLGGWVPHTFLVAVLDGAVVGRVDVRHRLDDHLRREGGHVGYGVRPAWRGRGVGTALLANGLAVAAEHGIEVALVTCDDANRASAATIEGAGGRLRDVGAVGGRRVRRYDVPTGPALTITIAGAGPGG